MSQWLKLITRCQQDRSFHERVTELYSRVLLPYKIRSGFAEWIEAQDWSSFDGNSEAGTRQGEVLFNELLARIQAVEENLQNTQPFDLEKLLDLQLSKQTMKKLFDGQFGSFIVVLSRCLQEEKVLLDSSNNEPNDQPPKPEAPPCTVEKVVEAREKLCDLHQHISVAENFVHEVARLQDEFLISYKQLNEKLDRLSAQLASPMIQNRAELINMQLSIQEEIEKLAQENSARRNSMADAHINLAIRLAWLLQVVWANIRKWQNEQKLIICGLSKQSKGNLDVIETLCDEGGKLLHRMIQQVERALIIFRKFQNRGTTIDEKLTQLEMVLRELVQDYLPKHLQCAFIVESNIPDRVLSVEGGKSNNFRLTVRILGGKALGLGFSRPKVRLLLVSERELMNSNGSTEPGSAAAQCVAADCTFAVDSSGRCRAEFHGVRVESTRQGGVTANSDANIGQKFAFVFVTTVHVCGCDIALKVVSLPVILTSCLVQEVTAKGLLVWDAAFSEPNRKAFACKDTVKWSTFAHVLSTLFLNNTGRGLTAEHLEYLAKLLFNEKKSTDFSSRPVTEKQAIRNKLPGRSFSFWTWIWANMAAVKDLVNNEWRAGLIHGFISKEDARRKLLDRPRGTFLLRFSETNIDIAPDGIHGYLTIAVIELDPQNNGRTKLYYVKDYLSPKDITDKGLSEILGAMEVADSLDGGHKKPLLCHLWPDTNRDFMSIFNGFRREIMSKPNSDGTQEDDYKTSKFTIEIFLEEANSNGGRMQRQVSVSSNTSLSAMATVESLGDLSVGDQHEFIIRTEDMRPIASVLPQPNQSVVMASVVALPRPQVPLGNGVTPHYAGAALSDMSDDDDSSMDSNMSSGAATFGAATQPVGQGVSFAGSFAAFNLHYQ